MAAQGAHDRSAIVIPAAHALKDRDLGVIAGEGQRISPRVKMTTHRCVMRNSTGNRISACVGGNVGAWTSKKIFTGRFI